LSRAYIAGAVLLDDGSSEYEGGESEVPREVDEACFSDDEGNLCVYSSEIEVLEEMFGSPLTVLPRLPAASEAPSADSALASSSAAAPLAASASPAAPASPPDSSPASLAAAASPGAPASNAASPGAAAPLVASASPAAPASPLDSDPASLAAAASNAAPKVRVVRKRCPECGSVVTVNLQLTKVRCVNFVQGVHRSITPPCKVFFTIKKWCTQVDA
jgi:hypothetical protein